MAEARRLDLVSAGVFMQDVWLIIDPRQLIFTQACPCATFNVIG